MKKFFLFMLIPFFVNAHEAAGMSLHIHFELLMALFLTLLSVIFFIKNYFSKV